MNAVRALKMTSASRASWIGVFALIFFAGLTFLALYLFSPDWLKFGSSLPVALISPLHADYSADSLGQAHQGPLNIALIGEVAQDQIIPTGQVSGNSLATLMGALYFPVPSITPMFGATSVFTLTPQPTQSGKSSATATLGGPLATGTPTPGATGLNATQPPTTIATQAPAATRQASTAIPPTSRPTNPPKPTSVPQPTKVPPTKVPPTKAPPTKVPPTKVPPTKVPPTNPPPTAYSPPSGYP